MNKAQDGPLLLKQTLHKMTSHLACSALASWPSRDLSRNRIQPCTGLSSGGYIAYDKHIFLFLSRIEILSFFFSLTPQLSALREMQVVAYVGDSSNVHIGVSEPSFLLPSMPMIAGTVNAPQQHKNSLFPALAEISQIKPKYLLLREQS